MDKASLIHKCQSGEREAFGILYHTYLSSMRDVVTFYIHNQDVVWDVLHDGFIVAFASIGALKDAEKVGSWLTSIMKNLSLQYLKEEANRKSEPLSDLADEHQDESDSHCSDLTWDELNLMIGKLPDGYGKVFRLAVLDGLSHKEIGAMLGIAPHSSSSQLSHAKAMLRRMIVKYRAEMGMLSVIGIIMLLWNGFFKHRENEHTTPVVSKVTEDIVPFAADTITDIYDSPDSLIAEPKIIYQITNPSQQERIADFETTVDSIPSVESESMDDDTVRILPQVINRRDLIAHEDKPRLFSKEKQNWSISLAYAGNLEQRELNRYRIPDPNLPDAEGPNGEIDVTEKTHHYMPVIIGLSVNKAIDSRWSVGTGVRYSYLRSDYHWESSLTNRETVQRIHYVGIPLKFNYQIVAYNHFSLYIQGGGALDIPVSGTQTIREYSQVWGNHDNRTIVVHAPLQWSLEWGIGMLYHFTPSVSIYAEPSFRYYFNPGGDVRTIRQEKPFEITIPIGLRLTW